MLTLAQLQQQFVKDLFSENNSLNYLQPNKTLTTRAQLNVYQNSIIAALQKILADIYPICYRLVGLDFFQGMTYRYSSQTVSTSPNLANYGDAFAEFIYHLPEATSVPYLADIAKLEWAWHKLQDAPLPKKIDFNKLALCYEHHSAEIIFTQPPATKILTSNYPIHKIWRQNQIADSNTTLNLLPQKKYYLLVWRDVTDCKVDLLTKADWEILTLFADELPLESIYSKIIKIQPERDLGELLNYLIKKNWLVDFYY